MLVSPQWPLTICDLQAEDKLFVQTFCLLTNYYGPGNLTSVGTPHHDCSGTGCHKGTPVQPLPAQRCSTASQLRLAFKLPEPCHSARPPGYYRCPSRFWPARLRGHGCHGLPAALVSVRESSVTNWTNTRHGRAMLVSIAQAAKHMLPVGAETSEKSALPN